MTWFRFIVAILLTGMVCFYRPAASQAADFIPIPDSGTPLAPSQAKFISGLVEVVSDPQNERIASDLNGAKARLYYRGWAFFDVPAGKSAPVSAEASRYVVLTGSDLSAMPELTAEDRTKIDEINGLLKSIAGRWVPQAERYFHWAAVGERYALLVGVGDVIWIDLVEGPVPQVHVLGRTATGWQLLLSTNLAAFIDIAPPRVRVSDVLAPFLARATTIRHPTKQDLGPIERRGEVVENPTKVGLDLFNREQCWACHRIAGTGGLLGPDLTHIGSRMPSRAWHIQHDKAPRSIQPRSIMPDYDHLSAEGRQALAQFLISLK